jgi:hypothetical protein
MFLLVVPLGLLLLVGGYMFLPTGPCTREKSSYDIPGALLVFFSLGIFTIGMNLGVQNHNLILLIGSMVITTILGFIFIRWEKIVRSPLIEFSFLLRRAILIPLILTFLMYLIYRISLYFIPIYLSEVLKVSPVNVGLILSIAAIIPAVGSPFIGYYTEKKGMRGIRTLTSVTALCGVASSVTLILTGVLNGLIAVIISLIFLGIFFTFGWTTMYAYYYRSIPPEKAGVAGGINETSCELAVPVAITLVQILFASGIIFISGDSISARDIIWKSIPGVQAIYLFCLILSLIILYIARRSIRIGSLSQNEKSEIPITGRTPHNRET